MNCFERQSNVLDIEVTLALMVTVFRRSRYASGVLETFVGVIGMDISRGIRYTIC